jgi:hypothetical protein
MKFGILDEYDEVIRWVWERPSGEYRYIVVKIKKKTIDWSNIEEGTF